MQFQDVKVKWENSKCPLLTKNCWESMKKQMNSSGILSQDFRHCRFFKRSRMICENGTSNLKIIHRPDHLHVDVQRHRMEKGNDGMCLSNSEKSRITRRDSCKDTGRFWVPERKRSGMEPYTPEETWDSTANQMVERFKDTGHPVFKSIGALSRGILKKKNGRDTIHFNADASNRELLFRIIHSVNQLSIYGAATKWYQLGRKNKTRLDEDDGFGQLIPLCREYTLSQVKPTIQIFCRRPFWRNTS